MRRLSLVLMRVFIFGNMFLSDFYAAAAEGILSEKLAPKSSVPSESFQKEYDSEVEKALALKRCAVNFCGSYVKTMNEPLDPVLLETRLKRLMDLWIYSPGDIETISQLCWRIKDTGSYTAGQEKEIRAVFGFLVLIGVREAQIKKILPFASVRLGLSESLEDSFVLPEEKNYPGGYYSPLSRFKKEAYYKNDVYIRFLDLKKGETFLDLMGGTGTEAAGIAENNPKTGVFMIDANAKNLYEAEKTVSDKKLNNVSLILRDVRPSKGGGIPLEDGAVNAVTISGYALAGYNHAELAEIFDEILRVTAPEGRIFIDYWEREGSGYEPAALYFAARGKRISLLPDFNLNGEKGSQLSSTISWFGARVGGPSDEEPVPRDQIKAGNDGEKQIVKLYKDWLAREEAKSKIAAGKAQIGPIDVRRLFLKTESIYWICEGLNTFYNVLPTRVIQWIANKDVSDELHRIVYRPGKIMLTASTVAGKIFGTGNFAFMGSSGGELLNNRIYPDDLISRLRLEDPALAALVQEHAVNVERMLQDLSRDIDLLAAHLELIKEGATRISAAQNREDLSKKFDTAIQRARNHFDFWAAMSGRELEFDLTKRGLLPVQKDFPQELPPLKDVVSELSKPAPAEIQIPSPVNAAN